MNLTVIIGAGGTGSYVLPLLLEHYDSDRYKEHAILLIDGDVLEERNLTRQGFYNEDLNKNKAEALVSHYDKRVHTTKLIYAPHYIESIAHLIKTIKIAGSFIGGIEEITLVSCVDNNMIRYRMELGQYHLLKEGVSRVRYIDAGNAEYYGQVLVNDHRPADIEWEDGQLHIHSGDTDSLFARTEGSFEDKLTYADFELSCDENAVSAPQNILANQFSAFQIFQAVATGNNLPMYFNAKTARSNKLELLEKEAAVAEINSLIQEDIYEQEITGQDEPVKLYF